MLILIVLSVLFIIGLVLNRSWKTSEVGFILSLLSGLVLFIALLALPISRMDTVSESRQFEAVRATITDARENGVPLESAAIQMKVVERNEWLAGAKYWRETIFRIWVHPIVDSLEPIR